MSDPANAAWDEVKQLVTGNPNRAQDDGDEAERRTKYARYKGFEGDSRLVAGELARFLAAGSAEGEDDCSASGPKRGTWEPSKPGEP